MCPTEQAARAGHREVRFGFRRTAAERQLDVPVAHDPHSRHRIHARSGRLRFSRIMRVRTGLKTGRAEPETLLSRTLSVRILGKE